MKRGGQRAKDPAGLLDAQRPAITRFLDASPPPSARAVLVVFDRQLVATLRPALLAFAQEEGPVLAWLSPSDVEAMVEEAKLYSSPARRGAILAKLRALPPCRERLVVVWIPEHIALGRLALDHQPALS